MFDLIFKAAVLLLVLGAMNYLRDMFEYGADHDSYWNNFFEAAFVGTPFVILSLLVFRHMGALHHKLARLAATDMLTGLPNRRAFLEAFSDAGPAAVPDIVMMVDVDHFKKVNDTYGHVVGDICLQQLADYMRQQVRATDVVARMGGEEFAVLLKGATLSEGQDIAGRIAHGCAIRSGADNFSVTTSVGYTRRRSDRPIEVVLKLADGALYRAKTEGRARACNAEASTHRDSPGCDSPGREVSLAS